MALVASSSSTSTTTQVLHHLLRPSPPTPNSRLYSSFLRPHSNSTSTKFNLTRYYQSTIFPLFSSHPTSTSTPLFFLSHSVSTSSLSFPPNTALTLHSLSSEEQEDEEEKEDDFDSEIENALLEEEDGDEDEEEGEEELGLEENVKGDEASLKVELKSSGLKVPTLTVKEKKELASYAHGLGKKLKCQLVGKSGVTSNVASSFIETLEANELLKIKIHRTCPGELDEVVQQLEKATGSVVVGQIGRTVIIYRPSLTKLKAEEKKRQVRRIFARKEAKSKPVLPSRGRVPKFSAPDRRRSTRI